MNRADKTPGSARASRETFETGGRRAVVAQEKTGKENQGDDGASPSSGGVLGETPSTAREARALPSTWWRALAHRWTWRMAWRDSRSQRHRLAIFSASIIAGIAALVAIHSLKSSVQIGIEKQTKALLGSDLQISSRHEFPSDALAQIAARAQRVSREVTFSSMLYFPKADAARMVQVRGIEGDFPFYGKVETSPPDAWQRLRANSGESGVLVEPALLDQFHAKIGDAVKLGEIELPILGAIVKAPPRSNRFGGFAPEIYSRLNDVKRTGLLGTSSLASYNLHLELARPEIAAELRKNFADSGWRFETPENRRDTLGDALDNFQQFLGIIALAALVLGAIGVAGAIHAHVSRRVPTVAILRCLGCPGDLAFGIYLAQAIALGLLGALAGTLLGVALHAGIVAFFRESLPVAIDAAPPWNVVAQTAAAGFAVCCGFALLPLLRVREISPAATLRENFSQKNARRAWPIYLLLAASLTLLTARDSSHWLRAVAMVGALGAAFLILAATAKLLVLAARRVVKPTWPYLLRQGISNLHRPHNQTLLFLLSLGLGTFLLLTILLSKNLLLARVNLARFSDSPNIYLIDVQPDQKDGVAALLHSLKLPLLESAPMVTMRIAAVRGVPVGELEKKHAAPRWILQREFRSTYRDHLNETETIVAGDWFSRTPNQRTGEPSDSAPVPLSLEESIARDLRIGVGDELTLDVQGVPIRARVTSLRKVDWSKFNLDFFMVFPPGVLENAPGFDVLTTRVPTSVSSGELQRALVRDFPNVTAIDLTLILETVRSILEKISRVISILAGFTVLAGMPILIGTLLNSREARVRESVLLRTLGASARQVRAILFVEYAALGALSALSGIVLAVAANAALAHFVFKAAPWPDARLLAAAFGSAVLLAVLGGLALSRGVTQRAPLEILRATD